MYKKYEMFKENDFDSFFRVRALHDFGNVKAGDIGGWIEKESNLSHDGDCWVSDIALVYGDARVSGYARVSGNAQVSGDARVYGYAQVFDNAWVSGDAKVSGNAWVYGDAHISGNAQVYGDAHISGNAQVYGNAQVSGDAWVSDNALVYDYALVYGDARVYGDAWVYGDAKVYGNARVSGYAEVCEYQYIQYGYVYEKLNTVTLLKHSLGVFPVNDKIILYKRVNSNMTSEHYSDFVYPEYGSVEELDTDQDSSVSCGRGLHFSHLYYSSWTNDGNYKFLAAEIDVNDIIAVQQGKVRCKKAFILGVDKVSKVCDNTTSNGEKKMTNNKTTRYAVIARSTGKVLKNAATREVAREWKRNSGKNGLGILDRNSGSVVS